MRRIRSTCCARAVSGHAIVPPSNETNSRRLTALPEAEDIIQKLKTIARPMILHEFLRIAPQAGVTTVVQRYALRDADQALDDLRAGKLEGAAVLIP